MCGISGLGTALMTGLKTVGTAIASGATKFGGAIKGLTTAGKGVVTGMTPSISNTANVTQTASTATKAASTAKNLGAIAGAVGGLGALGAGLLSMKGNKSGTAQVITSALENQTTPIEEVAKTATTVRQSDVSKIQRSLGALRIKQNNANSYLGVNTANSALNLNLGG